MPGMLQMFCQWLTSERNILQKGSEDSLAKKLEEVNAELRKSESRNSALSADLKKATGALSSAEAECTALKTKLQELEKHLSASDANKEMSVKLQVGSDQSQVQHCLWIWAREW